MNVLVSCEYQDGSAAVAGKSLAMCFGAIVALSKVLKSVSGVTSLSFHQDRWLPETLTFLFNKALRFGGTHHLSQYIYIYVMKSGSLLF